MRSLLLRVTARSPLAIRADHAASGAANTRYIPGTALRGALAMLYRKWYEGQDEMADFASLFLSEQVSYPNLYPARFDDEGLQGSDHLPVLPLPKTAQSCKRHPGFIFPDTHKNDGHGVRDTVIERALFNLAPAQARVELVAKLLAEDTCRYCREPMDHYDGFYRWNNMPPQQRIKADFTGYTRLQTRVGIDRAAGVVREGILYNRQVFEEEMLFWGRIAVHTEDDQLFDRLENFLQEVSDSGLLRIGTGSTRGMGKVFLYVPLPEQEDDPFSSFSQRLTVFSQTCHERARELSLSESVDPNTFFFAVTLHSPMILRDDLLRYHGVIDKAVLQKLLDFQLPELQQHLYSAASLRRVSGWQELWRTPRTNDYAIESGSVFIFTCSSLPSPAGLRALFTLEERGAGQRRSEGFGRLAISDPFHRYTKQEERA